MDFSAQSNISFIKQKIDDLEKITDQDNPYTSCLLYTSDAADE